MSQLAQLAAKLFNAADDFRPKMVSTEKRVRGILAEEYIFDTTSAKLVWENGYFPLYWIPRKDFLPVAEFTADKAISGIQPSTSTISVKKKSIPILLVPSSFNTELVDYVKIQQGDLDAWYEEEVKVNYHPVDPFHRVDVLPSKRHIRVEIDGTVVADTGGQEVMSLWETNFPGRWYIPRETVKKDYLKESDTKTGCPYKGQASYYHAVINGKEYKDVVWWYRDPLPESALVKDMLCFYPDKVDVYLDGKSLKPVPKQAAQPTKDKASRRAVGVVQQIPRNSHRFQSTLKANPNIHIFPSPSEPSISVMTLLKTNPPIESLSLGTTTAIPPTPQSFRNNDAFIPILNSVIAQHAHNDPQVQSQAAAYASGGGAMLFQTMRRTQTGSAGASAQGGAGSAGVGGYVHVYDNRHPPDFGRIPDPEDIFGSVEVDGNGKFVDGMGHYQASGTYRLVTNDGILGLSDYLMNKLKERLAKEEAALKK